MALIAEVFGFHMTHMAVRALQVLAVVRRNVRIGRFDLCGLFHKCVLLMARRASFDRGRLRIVRVGPVAHLAAQSFGLVPIGQKLSAAWAGSETVKSAQSEANKTDLAVPVIFDIFFSPGNEFKLAVTQMRGFNRSGGREQL